MPPQHSSKNEDDLLEELESHNAFFDNLVNMIPARLYVAGHSGDEAYHPKYLKGQHKESKEARRARNKLLKREKFDPEKMETTLETKRRLQQEQDEDDNDDESDDIPMAHQDDHDRDKDPGTGADNERQGEKSQQKNELPVDSNDSYASRIEMLRAKLHAKMAEKRAAAGLTSDAQGADSSAPINTLAPALVSKRAARRAEKRKRQEAAKERNKKKTNSSAEQNKNEPQRVVNLGGSILNATMISSPNGKSPATTAAQDLATIDYQSLAGLKPKLNPQYDNKSLNPKLQKKKKSLEKLLADAEKKQQRLKELKESSVDDDREKAKNIEWGEALKVAGRVLCCLKRLIYFFHLFCVITLRLFTHLQPFSSIDSC